MKRHQIDLLAAEYVLGTLDAETRARLRRRLPEDPALCRSIDAWQRRLSGLSLGEEALEPPAGLWDRIAPALGDAPRDAVDQPAEGVAVTVRAEEGQWEEVFPGVHKKHLFIDREAGYHAFLLRYEPGARLPAHPHSAPEECIMLEGDAWIGDLHLGAGDYHIVPGGTVHPEIRSENGGVVYVRGELREAS